MLVSAWRHQERPGDVGAHVGNHAPDHGVADLIEPGKTKQLQRLQELDAERSSVEQADRKPARASQRGQQQGIEPDCEAGEKTAKRAATRATFPEYAAEYRRSELRNGSE